MCEGLRMFQAKGTLCSNHWQNESFLLALTRAADSIWEMRAGKEEGKLNLGSEFPGP